MTDQLTETQRKAAEAEARATERAALLANPELLTIEHIRGWNGQEMLEYMKSPIGRRVAEVVSEANSKPRPVQPTETTALQRTDLRQARRLNAADEAALYAQQKAEEAQRLAEAEAEEAAAEAAEAAEAQRKASEAETQRVAAEEAEKVRLAAEALKPKKIVVEYQVKDEKGNPIGRPTHLEAATEEEMRQKLITAHEQATRAFHRLKSQKVTFEKTTQTPTQAGLSDAELLTLAKNLKSDDPAVALDAQKKIAKSEVDKQLAGERAENARLKGLIDAANASNQFLADHKDDFVNNTANVELISNYLKDNDMPWTKDNLEVAFIALESQLAHVDTPVTVAAADNPPTPTVPPQTVTQQPVASSTQATAPASASPANAAPATTTPAANTAPQPRPGVNTGIVPGESSAARPDETRNGPAIGLTITEILSWDSQTMRKNMANKAMRPKIEAVLAAENTPEKIAQRAARRASQEQLAGRR